jgi:hypothetical protein
VVLVALLAFGGVAAGIVAAQSGGETSTPEASATATKESTATDDTSTPSDSTDAATPSKREQLIDDYLSKLAANLGISVDELKSALTTTSEQMLDQAVADGKITQEEADKIKEKIESGDGPFLFPFGHHGRGGPGFDGHPFMRGFIVGFAGMDVIKQTADYLGVDRQTVIDGLQNGQSLAQIAEANGKTADGLSSYINDQLKSKLDEAVANNRITQERADSILSNAQEHIDDVINNTGVGKWRGPDMELPDGSMFPGDFGLDPSSL